MRITESQLRRIVKRIISEQAGGSDPYAQAAAIVKSAGPNLTAAKLQSVLPALARSAGSGVDDPGEYTSFILQDQFGVDPDSADFVGNEVKKIATSAYASKRKLSRSLRPKYSRDMDQAQTGVAADAEAWDKLGYPLG